MPTPSPRDLALLLLTGVVAGCPSLSNLHTARPLPVGESELAIALGAYAFRDDGDSGTEDEDLLPFIEVAARHGFSERHDAGIRLTALAMIGADLNIALLQGERVVVSVDPSVSILAAPIFVTYLWLPLLVDLDVSDKVTVTLTARVGRASVDSLDDDDDSIGLDGDATLYGLGVGLRWQLAKDWAIAPELHVVSPDRLQFSDDALLGLTLGFMR